MRCPEWHSWLFDNPYQPDGRCLWISGIPGAGKTIVAYYLITQLENLPSKAPAGPCVYYYCFHARNQDEAPHFLGWVVGQLCRHAYMIPPGLVGLFLENAEPDLEDLLDALASLLQRLGRAYVVLDAVDESRPRTELITVVSRLAREPRFQGLKLLVTSRDEPEIRRVFTNISTEISMCNPFVQEDIRKVVVSSFKEHRGTTFIRQSDEFIADATDAIVAKAKGMCVHTHTHTFSANLYDKPSKLICGL